MTEGAAENPASSGSLAAAFAFRGGIGAGKYFLGIGAVIVVMFLTLGALASAMNPTGGGAPFLAVPLLLLALYIHLAVTVARMRDTGRSPWLALLFVFGPMLWLAISIEIAAAADALWIVVVAGLLAFYAVPGLMDRKEAAPAA